ncbi:hypothetical protein JTT01_07835 [Clostridium botulinum]|nr:hypothetical protein [Clostridium botulinum]
MENPINKKDIKILPNGKIFLLIVMKIKLKDLYQEKKLNIMEF